MTEDGQELRVRFWEYRASGTCDILQFRALVPLHDTFKIQIATEHEQANVLLTAEIMNRGFGPTWRAVQEVAAAETSPMTAKRRQNSSHQRPSQETIAPKLSATPFGGEASAHLADFSSLPCLALSVVSKSWRHDNDMKQIKSD